MRKRCTKCGETKPLTEFSPNGAKRRSRCRKCHAAAEGQRRAAAGVDVVRRKQREWRRQQPERTVWHLMRQRCENPKASGFENYGGRGIRVCDRWQSFDAFLADMGTRPSAKHQLDRVDTNSDYSPENCRWATRAVQARNTRRTHMITFRGVSLCLTDWAARAGLTRAALKSRVARGWPIEKALTTPAREQ